MSLAIHFFRGTFRDEKSGENKRMGSGWNSKSLLIAEF